ncbi:hypothetical protein N7462_007403 [Penicillium macrosclerotiorum]|uniref:uncharacterized protein n=1 Tax=Penicillium macrosclerotiorum TaxID=303699 RepID=UPI0025477FC2|nr:uncharacterized protein N7462_007403 [Penicillium macrosclerotiorum]KAJ5679159.1 hypothetical protein N7462_007403 [Penicillium macrosclerotiorum]
MYQMYDGALTRFDLVWDEQQVWVGFPQPVTGGLIPVTFVSEKADSTPGFVEFSSRDEEPQPPGSTVFENQPTPSVAIESVPTDGFATDSPSHESVDVLELSPREAYLIRSYIQKIAAVVSLSRRLVLVVSIF